MIHDQALVDRLGNFNHRPFSGEVYRATTLSANPTAPSISGGRWAMPVNGDTGNSVLYTAFAKDGAIAEVASFLADQTPIPGPRKIKITRISVTVSKSVALTRDDLERLGVDMARYGDRDYEVTQRMGGALAFLGIDGLIAPSARWSCDNLMIFTDNHSLSETLEAIDDEQIEWQAWARKNKLIL